MSDSIPLHSDTIANLLEAVGPSILRVEARAWKPATALAYTESLVVAAAHAIEREEGLTLTGADGVSHNAQLIGRDPGTDIALLRIEGATLTPAPFAELEGIRAGTLVVAASRPGRTVRASMGIVHALGDSFRSHAGARVDRYLETDAYFPRGFSGGALLDLKGRVLGMTTTGLVRGANLAVPTVTIRRVLSELEAHGRVRKGYLGVGVYPARLPAPFAEQLEQPAGVVVVSIEPGSPAEQSGLLVGDVLFSLDGQKVSDPVALSAILSERSSGSFQARVLRAGAIAELSLTPGQRT